MTLRKRGGTGTRNTKHTVDNLKKKIEDKNKNYRKTKKKV